MTTATTERRANKTGRTIDVYRLQLAEVDELLGGHDTVQVDGVWYYTHDFGGYVVGSRTAKSVDYGDNDVGRKQRTAPKSLAGMAAPKGALPTRIQYSEPEIVGRCD